MPKTAEVKVALKGQALLESLFSKKQMALTVALGKAIIAQHNDMVTFKGVAVKAVIGLFPLGTTPTGEVWQAFSRGMAEEYGTASNAEYVRRMVGDAWKKSRATIEIVDGVEVETLGMVPTKGRTSGNGNGNAAKGKSPKRASASVVKKASDTLAYIVGLVGLGINDAKLTACITAGEALVAAAEAMQVDVKAAA